MAGLLSFRSTAGASGTPVKLTGAPITQLERFLGGMLRVFAAGHPCLGARQLGSQSGLFYAVYSDMSSLRCAFELLEDLDDYLARTEDIPILKSFVPIFEEPICSPSDFADKFWAFAQLLNRIDALSHPYDPSVSSNPNDPRFEFSLRGKAVFPTTLHPHHPRTARRFPYPAWAHNQSAQFQQLRESGEFENWQKKIRTVDAKLDKSKQPNPLLADHGDASAAIQLGQLELASYPFQPFQDSDRLKNWMELMDLCASEGSDPRIMDRLNQLRP